MLTTQGYYMSLVAWINRKFPKALTLCFLSSMPFPFIFNLKTRGKLCEQIRKDYPEGRVIWKDGDGKEVGALCKTGGKS